MSKRILSLLRNLFQKRTLEQALEDELCSTLEVLMDEKIKQGLSRSSARREALIEIGGIAQVTESVRRARSGHFIGGLARDIHYGLRQLIKSPSFSFTAILTLTLGIGANSAVFSVLDTILLRPLSYPNSDRLVRIYSVIKGDAVGPSPLDSRDFAEQNRTFEHLAVFDQWRKNVTVTRAGSIAENVNVGLGNRDLFEVFGIHPLLGRLFTVEEGIPGRNHVAMISEAFWQSHYARDPGILGRTITINGSAYTIIGVIPHGLPGWLRGISSSLEVWEPFVPVPGIWNDAERAERDFTTVGLLRKGVSIHEAEADLGTIAARLAGTYPIDRSVGVSIEPLATSRAGDLRPELYMLMSAVALILLIACSNLASLLLARNSARRREFAMRAALGAGRTTLIRQVLVETLLLSLIGGTLGVALAEGIDFAIRQDHPGSIPQLAEISLDWRVLAFASLVALSTSLIFGLAPAVMSTKIDVSKALREGGRGTSAPIRHRFRKSLVIGQMALSLVLTVAAALFLQSILKLMHQEMGFEPDHLIKAHFFLPSAQYPTPDSITRFSDRFGDQLRAIPGVKEASITTIYPPLQRWSTEFWVESHPISRAEDIPSTFFGVTDPYYLKSAGIALISGRDFRSTDRENTPIVAIVNQTFVRHFLRGEDPLGKHINLGVPPGIPIVDPWMRQNVGVTIIGVMTDAKNDGLAQPVEPQLITLFRQMPDVNFGFRDILVRSDLPPSALETAIVAQLHQLDPTLPLSEMMTMDERLIDLTNDRRFSGMILSTFAVMGVLLAVVGIYGVVSYLVAQRNQELGIRLALGADRADVLWLIVRQGTALAVSGIFIGIAGAAFAGRAIASLLFNISPMDTVTLIVASTSLLTVALAASAIPAWRATRIDPIEVLRAE